jgi:hypothetical protein
LRFALVLALAATLQGCIAYTVASTAVSVTATAVEATAEVIGGAVDLAIPDGEDGKD